MRLTGLIDNLRQTQDYQSLLAELQKSDRRHRPIIRSARPYVVGALAQDWQGPIIYLTARGKRVHTVAEQLPVWLEDEARIHRYAEPTPMFYDRLAWDADVIRERLNALYALMDEDSGSAPIIISSARALMQRTLSPHLFRRHSHQIEVGQRYKIDVLVQDWLNHGYEPVTMVIEPGTFTRRGGLLDIYPINATSPVRLDLFDDDLDTLRHFDPATQRTTEKIRSITIPPAREALPLNTPPLAGHLADWFNGLTQNKDDVHTAVQDADALEHGTAFPFLEHYLPYLYEAPISLLDYASPDTLLIVEDIDDLREEIIALAEGAEANRESNIATQQIAPDHPVPYVDWETIEADIERHHVLHLSITSLADLDNVAVNARWFMPGERFGGQLRHALTYVTEKRAANETVIVVSQQIDRIVELWQEQSTQFAPKLASITEPLHNDSLIFVSGSLTEGWSAPHGDMPLHLLTDAEIFNWSRPEPRRRTAGHAKRGKLPESDYSAWENGDYVVHVDYGIGRFAGLRTRTVEGNEREYLLIEYAGTDSLFVPIHQSDRLTRFVGPDEAPPRLNKLGKSDVWIKAKSKAKQAAEEEARELLEIYARRASSGGHHFQPDTPWQHELEASFPFVETEDQVRVLREIKRDMESPMPMDRLVCGDVGYGKTEVALRAAFKAVMDGRQVAILVPTTVLAEQHYQTFSERMAPFPLKVESISRFRTKAEQAKIIDDLASGEVDIIIGTHRLLSKDVAFHDLGLIVIDEEQRFGVKHKEHFKKLRSEVDILTLTATPIPRTLYMSLSGVRDISMIQTPPEERLPVITHVGPFDPKLTRQAILRELDRGGQVFIIHNRVRSIQTTKERFQEIVPEASIVVAHGQMNGPMLEGVISAFTKGEYDILLATSIIENGIDMPNVNTLIVDRAEWFGMSQLYQIRGRVGRGAQQAYAYMFHAGGNRLTEEAKFRLETMAEHAQLGSGFQIAVRDLELRGAGDILSTNQTGHVASVGLQLYTQLLQQAVKRLKGEEDTGAKPSYDQERIIIDLPLPTYIPNDWIDEMALRLQLYRRIGSLQTEADVEMMALELEDRFGKLPRAVRGLLYQIRVKLLAQTINATSVIKPRQHILIKLPWLAAVDRDALAHSLGDDVEVSRTAVELAHIPELWQERLLEILEALQEGLPEHIGSKI
ncbi:MAG: transcription-repair coupling factor [Anaerolineaceae bacterium]|nr:transcription-repair coupling factor [Anaerolineaceae bacterium]